MIISVIGARPQFIKAAVVSKALRQAKILEQIVHTGQHYDPRMSTVFWDELDLPTTHVNLEVGSGSQGAQTAKIIEKLEEYLISLPLSPKAILVYGDTNSTLAASIVASKMQIPIIHVEAGLRSFNRSMPEEINRIVTDHLSSLLFCSSEVGVLQLAREGIKTNVFITGDVMYDAVKAFENIAQKNVSINEIVPIEEKKFCLLTMHRPSNTDSNENIISILSAIGSIEIPVLWPLHPRLKMKISEHKVPSNVHLVEPLSYFQMLCALKNCYKVFTDSGGLQKEAYWLKKPCITLRTETEWIETMHHSWNILAGSDYNSIIQAFEKKIDLTSWTPLYGDGTASQQIARKIRAFLGLVK